MKKFKTTRLVCTLIIILSTFLTYGQVEEEEPPAFEPDVVDNVPINDFIHIGFIIAIILAFCVFQSKYFNKFITFKKE